MPDAAYYFVHSYHVRPNHPGDIAAVTHYGTEIPSVVIRDNIWGMQFHPEKSHQAGLNLIQQWLKT